MANEKRKVVRRIKASTDGAKSTKGCGHGNGSQTAA